MKEKNKNQNPHLTYQQLYYIKNREKIKSYQRNYYQDKKGNNKNYYFEIKQGLFTIDFKK